MQPERSTCAEKGSKSLERKPGRDDHQEDGGSNGITIESGTATFSKLMEGVVFALSGFVNPERNLLRSHALEMGAEYRPDWTSDCTLLVCAFRNTPKFRQVAADFGTIVSKEWVSECYRQKRLIEIGSYLMHVGMPWRKINNCNQSDQGWRLKLHDKQQTESNRKPAFCIIPHENISDIARVHFSMSEVEAWAIDDMKETVLWLASQEEKPEPNEIMNIASQGILTCLLDCITALDHNKEIRHVITEWKFVPRVVKELAKLEELTNTEGLLSKDQLYQQAITCKRICQRVFDHKVAHFMNWKKWRIGGTKEDEERNETETHATEYDSDKTIEMTEEEIEQACKYLGEHICDMGPGEKSV